MELLIIVTLGNFYGQLSVVKYLNFIFHYVLLLNKLGKIGWPFLRPAALL